MYQQTCNFSSHRVHIVAAINLRLPKRVRHVLLHIQKLFETLLNQIAKAISELEICIGYSLYYRRLMAATGFGLLQTLLAEQNAVTVAATGLVFSWVLQVPAVGITRLVLS